MMMSRCNSRFQRWAPRRRRCTVVQPWTGLWVVPAHPNLRCHGCRRRVTTPYCLVATFPSRDDWRHGNLGSPQTGAVYCGDCARAWYGVWPTDLHQPLYTLWECWGPLVRLSRLVVEGELGHQRYAYRLSPYWRHHLPRHP